MVGHCSPYIRERGAVDVKTRRAIFFLTKTVIPMTLPCARENYARVVQGSQKCAIYGRSIFVGYILARDQEEMLLERVGFYNTTLVFYDIMVILQGYFLKHISDMSHCDETWVHLSICPEHLPVGLDSSGHPFWRNGHVICIVRCLAIVIVVS